MEIINIKIKSVKIGLDDRDRLAASLSFEAANNHCCAWSFILTNQADSQRLKALLEYAGVNDVADLKGIIVRAVNFKNLFKGFGDPIEDKFTPNFGEEVLEVSSEEFLKLLTK